MICKFCGSELMPESVFCRKCGKKLDEQETQRQRKVILKYLNNKKEETDLVGQKDYYEKLIHRWNNQEFKKVEIHSCPLEEILHLEDVIYEDEDTFHINCTDANDLVKLGFALVINEFDSLNEMIGSIEKEFHNDRIAHLKSAYQLYRRAILSEETNEKNQQLANATDNCIRALAELEEELVNHLQFWEQFPKNKVKKLKYIFQIKHLETRLDETQKAFIWYYNGVQLLLNIDFCNSDYKKLYDTIYTKRDFLDKINKLKGLERLLEVDDENRERWIEQINDMYNTMNYLETVIDENRRNENEQRIE